MVFWECFALAKVLENKNEIKLRLNKLQEIKFYFIVLNLCCQIVTGCSQEEGPRYGFIMGSRTQGVQEILEKYI